MGTEMRRRDFLKALIAAPAAAFLGLHTHIHHYEPDPSIYGYSCRCGAWRYKEREQQTFTIASHQHAAFALEDVQHLHTVFYTPPQSYKIPISVAKPLLDRRRNGQIA